MVTDIRIIDIITRLGSYELEYMSYEEDISYLTNFINEVTTENYNLKQEIKKSNNIIGDLKRNKNLLLYDVEKILNNVQVELNKVLDEIEGDK